MNMLMKKRGLVWLAVFLFIVAGCSGGNSSSQWPDMPQMIDVQISTDPEVVKPNEPVKILAKVTLGDEDVNDADEVVFEIWAEGQEDQAEKIDGHFEGNGIYSVTKTFDEGVYYAISHVTLREMHNMPKLKIVVGDVSDEN